METKHDLTKRLNRLKLLYIDSSRFDSDWHSTLHSHPFAELMYVVRGSGYFRFADNLKLPIQADDLIIINPNVLHTECSDAEGGLEYIVLGIDGVEFYTEQNAHPGVSIHNYEDYKHEILFYIKAILEAGKTHDEMSELIVENLLRVLVLNTMRRTTSLLDVETSTGGENKDCIFLEHYLNLHYRENITLDHLASLTFLNKFYLSHIFKEQTGLSPIDYLLRKRMIEAKKLLVNTDLSITQISDIVGFRSPSYFSQFFKNVESMSPSTYRKNHASLSKS
ncbi:AraC family transcriptional regulator, partial [Erysipelothrix rhusiopathiae]